MTYNVLSGTLSLYITTTTWLGLWVSVKHAFTCVYRTLFNRVPSGVVVVLCSKKARFDKMNWLRLQMNRFKKETQENVHRVCNLSPFLIAVFDIFIPRAVR